MTSNQQVAAIVVTFNRKELLIKVLAALVKQTYTPDALFIIDNASTDGTPELLKEIGYLETLPDNEKLCGEWVKNYALPQAPEKKLAIHYVRLSENTGGAGGFHAGVKKVYEAGFEWLWIMDDDVRPDEKCLENLLAYKEQSKVLIPLRLSREINVIDFPAIKYDLQKPFLKEVRDSSAYLQYKDIADMPETMPVEDFSFEGPMINREIVGRIGFPKADLFIWGDDTDYSLRIRYKAGQKLTLVRDAKIYRMLDPVLSKEVNWKTYYMLRNVNYINRAYGENMLVKMKPLYLFAGVFFKNLLRLDFKKAKVAYYALIDSYKEELPKRFLPGSKI